MSDFEFTGPSERRKWLYFPCQGKPPRSAGGVVGHCSVPINGQKDGKGNSWNWDGNEAAPTVTPSINCGDCKWHGHVQAGKMVSC